MSASAMTPDVAAAGLALPGAATGTDAGAGAGALPRAATIGSIRPRPTPARAMATPRRVNVRPTASSMRVQSWSAGVGAGATSRPARAPRSTRVTPLHPPSDAAARAGRGSPGAAGYRAYRGGGGKGGKAARGLGARAVRRLIRRGTHQLSALVLLPDEVLANVLAHCTGRELHRLKLSCRSLYVQVEGVDAYHDWRADKIVARNRRINLSAAQRARIETMPEQTCVSMCSPPPPTHTRAPPPSPPHRRPLPSLSSCVCAMPAVCLGEDEHPAHPPLHAAAQPVPERAVCSLGEEPSRVDGGQDA